MSEDTGFGFWGRGLGGVRSICYMGSFDAASSVWCFWWFLLGKHFGIMKEVKSWERLALAMDGEYMTAGIMADSWLVIQSRGTQIWWPLSNYQIGIR